MGCTSSKQALRDVRGQSPYARSYSGPVVGVNHTVAFKSSTLGSLSLDGAAAGDEETMKSSNDARSPPPVAARKLPRTPTKTPLHEPEVINVWELMEGLDDCGDDVDVEDRVSSLVLHGPAVVDRSLDRSFSFHSGVDMKHQLRSPADSPEFFDPEILSAFRKALDELSPSPPHGETHPFDAECIKKREIQRFPGIVRARIKVFQERIDAKLAKMAPLAVKRPPGCDRKVVFYFTSLRGIRKTYEDCWLTKVILQGYGVRIDERDLSMHAGYKDELNDVFDGFAVKLPRVFADGKYLGGAEEVRRMHESGELAKELEGCDMAVSGKGGEPEACIGCGGMRFVPCDACSGSCKVFVEEEEEGGGGFRRCLECNENGLVRCPACCL